jgi:hypothetical protein
MKSKENKEETKRPKAQKRLRAGAKTKSQTECVTVRGAERERRIFFFSAKLI